MQLYRQFPIKSDKPQIQVMLPVGTHTLELVVVDDANQSSAPVQVVIEVKKRTEVPVQTNPPNIQSMDPNELQSDDQQEWKEQVVVINGSHLNEATTIAITYLENPAMGAPPGTQPVKHELEYSLQPGGQVSKRPADVEDRIKLVKWELAGSSLRLTLGVSKDAEDQDTGTIGVKNQAGGNEVDFFIKPV